MKQENINNKVLDDLDKRIDNWNKLEGVPERVDVLETDATTLELRVGENETDIASLETNKQETKVKISSVEKELNSLKSININSNQEAKQVAHGHGVVSLPKTAGAGKADFGIKGLTATNLVENGDFSDGTVGWGVSFLTNIIVVDGILEMTPVQQWGQFFSNGFQIKVDNKYYVSAKVKSPTRLYLGLDKVAILPRTSGSNIWEMYSTIHVSTTNSNNGTFGFIDASTSDFKTSYFDDMSVINLTQTFGAGNEPTKEECDVIFSNYFDGTKSTISASRLKSVGKNLFDVGLETGYWDVNTGVKGINSAVRCKTHIRVTPNTPYRISNLSSDNTIWLVFYDRYKNHISNGFGSTFTTPINCEYFTFYRLGALLSDLVQVEEGTIATPYEPYTESTQYLPNVGELRSLPNGVCDEIRIG